MEQLQSILTDLDNKVITKHQAYDLILVLFDVVGRSEQFYCNCSRAKGLDYDEEGMPYCIECQKPVQ